jgi:hypothetical protein
MKMDEKTRELYAAIGRGETVQWKPFDVKDWHEWTPGYTYVLGVASVEWRIKPKTRTAIIDGVTYEWPEPMKEDGEWYYVWADGIIAVISFNSTYPEGRCFDTREGAEAFARADKALRGVK